MSAFVGAHTLLFPLLNLPGARDGRIQALRSMLGHCEHARMRVRLLFIYCKPPLNSPSSSQTTLSR